MKRTLGILLLALALAVSGCSKAKPTNSPPPDPAPGPQPVAEAPKPEPPKPSEPISGPIYLLEKPATPLWDGPASVVIENSPQAWPQAGFHDADLVVEGLSESEVTRTLSFFWSRPAPKIGPIRSARTWLVAMADAYHTPFAHSGGNNDALLILRDQWGPSNLDEIYTAGGYFYRTKDRQPPHNLYMTTDLMNQAIKERKIGMKPVPATPRAAQVADGAAAPPAVKRVDVAWHSLHAMAWEWDGKQYLRSEHYKPRASAAPDFTPHKVESGAQIAAPNLVFLEIKGRNDGWELGWNLNFSQGGKATVLAGGQLWEGTWKLGEGGFALEPAAGAKVPPLVPGLVWAHLITQESSFTVTK